MLHPMIAAAAASFAFSAHVTNAWFPLRPGDRAVRDRRYLNGKLEERTTDW
jgi:hypothetical protein